MGLTIGNVKLEHGLALAPMAGYTDRAMRLVCRECGAEYSTTEMVSAKAVTFGDRKTVDLARILPDEGAVALQIFGSEPDVMAEAAELLSGGYAGGAMPAAIDINMGCPVKKIFGNGEGSALMRDPELIHRIVASVSGATELPVTVKLRAGVDKEHINAVECALAAEAGGAALIAVHGRTRAELYGGSADWEIIKRVKAAVRVPVIANGDVTDAASALEVIRSTGADGIMVGRGAVGNPFVFREIACALSGASYAVPTLADRKAMALHQLRLAAEEKGEAVAVSEARKQIASYFKGFRGAAQLRGRINTLCVLRDVERAIEDIDE